MPTLDEIARKYGTDKATDVHSYTITYDQLFAPIREAHINLLEIGVYKGASIRTWEEYFPNARITGVEIEACHDKFSSKTTIIKADALSAAEMVMVAYAEGPFDIVIDDASHEHADQMAAFYTIFPKYMNPGGMYFIEDLYYPDDPTRRYFTEIFKVRDAAHIGADKVETYNSNMALLVVHKGKSPGV